MTGDRWRLVTVTNGRADVSSLVLTADEVDEQLEGEAMIAKLAGWQVTVGDRVVVCRRRDTVRTVQGRCFTATGDYQRHVRR